MILGETITRAIYRQYYGQEVEGTADESCRRIPRPAGRICFICRLPDSSGLSATGLRIPCVLHVTTSTQTSATHSPLHLVHDGVRRWKTRERMEGRPVVGEDQHVKPWSKSRNDLADRRSQELRNRAECLSFQVTVVHVLCADRAAARLRHPRRVTDHTAHAASSIKIICLDYHTPKINARLLLPNISFPDLTVAAWV